MKRKERCPCHAAAQVPGTRIASAVTSLEHFAGILLSSILLGLVVAKASLPSSKLVFSKAMLVTPRNGVPKLIARVCNTRGNYLLNPEVLPPGPECELLSRICCND